MPGESARALALATAVLVAGGCSGPAAAHDAGGHSGAAASEGRGDGAAAAGDAGAQSSPSAAPSEAATVEPLLPTVSLHPGQTIESSLTVAARRSYTLTGVKAGDLLEVSIEQLGINARFRLLGPDGTQVAEQSGVPGRQGTERMALLAPAAGDYTLLVKAAHRRAPPGRMRLMVGRWGPPDAAGRRRAAAWTALSRARDVTRQAGAALAAAPAAWDRAQALARRAGDRAWQADAVAGQAWAQLLLGNPARARPLWQEARRRAHALGDAVGEARALYALAEADADLGHLSQALPLWHQVVERCQAVGDVVDAAKALHNMGSTYGDLGEPRKALELLGQAEEAIRAYGGDAAYTILAQATVYHRLGDAGRALPLYRRARRLLHRDHLVWDEASAVEGAAGLYLDLLHQPARARRMFSQSLALHREANDAIGAAGAQVGLGDALRMQGDVAGAAEAHQQALALFRAKRRREGQADALTSLAADRLAGLRARVISVAAAARLPGPAELARAAGTAEDAVAAARVLGRRSQQAQALAILARIERARGRPAAALRDTDAALDLAEDVRSRIIAPELRTSQFASQVRDLYQLRIDLHPGRPVPRHRRRGRGRVRGQRALTRPHPG